jgi:ankyrin repeat protein
VDVQLSTKNLSKLIEAPLNEEYFLKLLQEEEIDVAGRDMFGLTALSKVAAWDKPVACSALLNLHPELINSVDAKGNSALHHAYSMNAERCIALLLQRNASETGKNKEGKTPKEMQEE